LKTDTDNSGGIRFPTKVDVWLGIVLGASILLTLGLPLYVLGDAALRHSKTPVYVAVMIPTALLWILALAATIPQYYDLGEDGLFIRQGWRKTLIPYPSLVRVEKVDSYASAGVYSGQRILISTKLQKQFLIAPQNRDRFIDYLRAKAPGVGGDNF